MTTPFKSQTRVSGWFSWALNSSETFKIGQKFLVWCKSIWFHPPSSRQICLNPDWYVFYCMGSAVWCFGIGMQCFVLMYYLADFRCWGFTPFNCLNTVLSKGFSAYKVHCGVGMKNSYFIDINYNVITRYDSREGIVAKAKWTRTLVGSKTVGTVLSDEGSPRIQQGPPNPSKPWKPKQHCPDPIWSTTS